MDMTRYFETRKRESGESFVTLTDDRPEWLHDAVMAAHDDELPNDWRYETCRDIVQALAELDDDADMDDAPWQIADMLTPAYNAQRVGWLADDLRRVSYIDDVMQDMGGPGGLDVFDQIGAGIARCVECMVRVFIDAMAEAEAVTS
jgi:hypothetical protein